MGRFKKNNVIREDTFGDPEKFPSLITITDRINKLPPTTHQRRYITSFINDFNRLFKYINDSPPPHQFTHYLTHLIKIEKYSKLNELKLKGIDPVLISHIECFITAKLRIIINNN